MVELNDDLVETLKSVSPRVAVWRFAAQSMLQYPADVALLHIARGVDTAEALRAERQLARVSAMVRRERTSWGKAFGDVRVTSLVDGPYRVHIISAFGRLALLVSAAGEPRVSVEELGAWLGSAVPYAALYSMDWAAAAHVLASEPVAILAADELLQFPKGPTNSMLEVLPAASRIAGVCPWKPHVFARALAAAFRGGSSEFIAGSALLHLVMERGASRAAWVSLFASLGVHTELPARPTIQQMAPFWRPGLKQVGFDIAREWQRLVGGHIADAATPTPRVRPRKSAAGGAR